MTLGDISWNGGGAVGYAASVNRGLPSGGTLSITSSAQVAAFVSAVQGGNKRIVIDPGVTLVLPAATINVGNNVQVICLSGRATIDCRAVGNQTAFFLHAQVIFGNIWFIRAKGDVNAGAVGNSASLFEFASTDSDLVYLIGCTMDQADDIGSYPNDGGEGFNSWDNTGTGTGPQRYTIHYCRFIVAGGVTKGVILGGYLMLSRLRTTMYKSVSYTKFRFPLNRGHAYADVVNCVYPAADRDASVEISDGSLTDVRGCMFSSNGNFNNLGDYQGGGLPVVYAPGTGVDGIQANFRQAPPIDFGPTQSTSAIGFKPYSLNPDPASQALMDQLIAEAGAGGIITIAVEGSAPTYVNPPQAVVGLRHLVKGIGR